MAMDERQFRFDAGTDSIDMRFVATQIRENKE